ncbi:DEAD/DEAH box helicase [Micromonospora sp. NPDC049523]|uniref:DEAD/DEAH box helicase n=1 Tax=Micromonospora sp. NPDC049523 TaxID=3155921 RepID=UPI0034306C07
MTGAGRDAAWQLHPSVLHHVVNTLGWSGLRPAQQAAVAPLMAGEDVIMVAPTAGGKTEAAMLPLLSRMAEQGWTGTSVLYLCPLKALLNNLLPRMERYADWLGRRAAIWHGDTTAGHRRKSLREQPDILLTTPESLEAMLVSANVDHATFFCDVRAVVVDELHAFAGDDRGWHLLAVLERLSRLIGRPVQRVGLSATVGNPDALLPWLQGSGRRRRPGRVVAPPAAGTPQNADIELDYVGSIHNAAKIIAALHHGEKRLVFCESRKRVEELGTALRGNGVTTFLSHASLSIDERRRAEAAFAEARDCVIVSTSTLELGIDVGDLDRVIQIDAPRTVASFLQRIGRTGRRPNSQRNCMFLTTDRQSLVQAAALLVLWSRGWVEPVLPPPEPRHIVAQQILALCLQQHRIGEHTWAQWWNGLEPFTEQTSATIARHLIDHGYLERDGGMLFIGPQAELRFGRRNFMGITAVFTTPPEFTVLAGRTELGRVDPAVLVEEMQGPRRLLLGGRSWQVTYIDWTRRRCFVEPADGGGRARWTGLGIAGLSFALSRAMREVLIGADPPVKLTQRATQRLADIRHEDTGLARTDGTVIVRAGSGDLRWWTWAGYRANATLASTLDGLTDPMQNHEDNYIRLRKDLLPAEWKAGTAGAAERMCLPHVDEKALAGLKFSVALPERLATATLAARIADLDGAAAVLAEPTYFAIE